MTDAHTTPDVAGPVAAAVTERRGLKLVVTLRPAGDGGYRALLALMADGCDPSFRSTTVDGMAAALDEVPALLADAEERWRAQPRYPALPPSTRAGRANTSAPRAAPPAAPAPDAAPLPAPEPTGPAAAAPKAAPRGQLNLFS